MGNNGQISPLVNIATSGWMRASHVSTRPDNDYEQYEGNDHAENAGKRIKVHGWHLSYSFSLLTGSSSLRCPYQRYWPESVGNVKANLAF